MQVNESIRFICGALDLNPELRYTGGTRGWIGDNPFIFSRHQEDPGNGLEATKSSTIEEGIVKTVRWLNRTDGSLIQERPKPHRNSHEGTLPRRSRQIRALRPAGARRRHRANPRRRQLLPRAGCREVRAGSALAIGTAYAIAFNSGTSALHVAARLLNLGPGDEGVITTPYTFIATSWAIAYVRATPVYVDVEDATLNINPTRIEQAITSRTKAILPVTCTATHLRGSDSQLCRSRNYL